MAYPDIRLGSIDGNNIRALSEIPDNLAEIGINPPSGVTEATERHAQILEHIASTAASVNAETAHAAAARSLADGTGTIEQITAAAATQMITAKGAHTPYNMIINQARALAAADLQKAYAEPGDAWITKSLRPALEKAVAVFSDETQHIADADAFMDPTGADYLTRNPKVGDAWVAIRTIYATARTLRRYRVIPGSGRRADIYEWSGEADHHIRKAGDHLIANIRDNMIDANITWFIMAIQNGMTPVLLTEKELAGRG